jgi:hypothetical protein
LDRIGEHLIDAVNPVLAANRVGAVEQATNFHGFVWNKAPIIMPYLRTEKAGGGDFLVGGMVPGGITNTAPPVVTLNEVVSLTNLVAYDREVTGARLEAWMYLSQLLRMAFRRAQVPGTSAGFPFIRAVIPMVAPSKTVVTKTGPAELTLERTSSLGLTSTEIHLLVDWLESPNFPRGFYTLLADLPPYPGMPRNVTNPPPVSPK